MCIICTISMYNIDEYLLFNYNSFKISTIVLYDT